jgi:hypothetical protein
LLLEGQTKVIVESVTRARRRFPSSASLLQCPSVCLFAWLTFEITSVSAGLSAPPGSAAGERIEQEHPMLYPYLVKGLANMDAERPEESSINLASGTIAAIRVRTTSLPCNVILPLQELRVTASSRCRPRRFAERRHWLANRLLSSFESQSSSLCLGCLGLGAQYSKKRDIAQP